jgi:3-isopropylmalate/(R)-2-methylmalate dehydratase large subunit
MPKTLFEKIWDRHVITTRAGQTLLYVDRHIIHDSSLHAFANLDKRGIAVRKKALTFGTPDHYVPTVSRDPADCPTPEIRHMVTLYASNMKKHAVPSFKLEDERQGIVHIIGPEQGLTLPGQLLVCGDSHTSTHGALGALAFGIGQSENEHVLATQTLWQGPSKTMRITVDGVRPQGVTAKDVILAIIGRIGAGGAVGHVVEYAGSAIRDMSIEERLTVCNMSIEAGARAGMVAPDEKTFAYVEGRPMAPKGSAWDAALAYWKTLPSDADAKFDREVRLDAAELQPMITWGTSPENALPITAVVPGEPRRALEYMGLKEGVPLEGIAIDRVFIGSCTNSRIEDLRAAAAVAKGRKAKVQAIVAPGSGLVKKQAEAEGLDRIFKEAGFEWRFAGCSMCVGMNGDLGKPQERIASTSNRNFEGRQGKGVRTHLMSPAMAAAAAVSGKITDVRKL